MSILPAVTWLLLQFPDLEAGQQTFVNGGKSSFLKEKEIVAGTDCLETSLYIVLRFLPSYSTHNITQKFSFFGSY